MNQRGLVTCLRYAHAPNSLHLCGPEKQGNLSHYFLNTVTTNETVELLKQFSTLYPYLRFIASENKIPDPFDPSIVEAYWIGNNLLHTIPISAFIHHVNTSFSIEKKLSYKMKTALYNAIGQGGYPNHAFHVINVYRRTGANPDMHTLASINACLIQAGTVTSIHKTHFVVRTNPIILRNSQLCYGSQTTTIITYNPTDIIAKKVRVSDIISFHWQQFCSRLSPQQTKTLMLYTLKALQYYSIHA